MTPHRNLLVVGLVVATCAPRAVQAQENRRHVPWEVPGLDFSPNGVWRARARQVRLNRARLLAAGRFEVLNAAVLGPSPAATAVSGTLREPLILFKFKDTQAGALVGDTSAYNGVLFASVPPFGRPYTVRTYYEEMSRISGGPPLQSIQGQGFGFFTLDSSEVFYTGGTSSTCRQKNPFMVSNCNGIWSDPAFTRMQTGLIEALRRADSVVNWAAFTSHGDTLDLVVFVQPAKDGACGGAPSGASASTNNHIWAHRATLNPPFVTHSPAPAGGNLKVVDYIIQSGVGGEVSCDTTQIMPIGTVAHETGHAFGLPDLYDTGGNTEGIGRWSLMGAGNYSSPASPARMDAWSLSQLGWVTVAPLPTAGAYVFGPAPTSDTAFLVRPSGANPRGEYFLLENREPVLADSALIRNACQVWYQQPNPSPCNGGLLVYHVDSEQIALHGFDQDNSVNAGPIHGLAVLQADGRGNLDANPNVTSCTPPAAGCADRGDAGDPYPGIMGNTTLAFSTTPSDTLNTGACSGFRIDTISQVPPNGAMRFVLAAEAGALTVTTTPQLPTGQWGYSYSTVLSAACGRGSYTWAVDSGAAPPGTALSPAGVLSGAPADTGRHTFRVSLTDGADTTRRTMTLQIAEPTLTLQQVLNVAFQGPAAAGDNQRRYLDLQGNANGGFDLGDVLRWLERTGNVAATGAVMQLERRRP
ncbi:MAG TPA: immune inhibitor A domain-containing protein [Gemmatimonadales bacterium]